VPRPKKPTTLETPVDDPEKAWERFERLARKIVSVPKEAIHEPKKDKPQPQS
jgi:hypothetical protein